MDPNDNLQKIMDAINKRSGDESIIFGDRPKEVSRLSTGSFALDYATSGGIPIGRFSRFYGGYSSMKSMTCWRIIKEAQSKGMTCAYYNIEKQYDKVFVEKIGVDTSKLLVVEGSIIEEVGANAEALLSEVDVHVFDSCTAAISTDELNSSLTDWHVGMAARVWGKVLKALNERFDHDRNIIILVDQIRNSIGYGGGITVPGGNALNHVSSMNLLFKSGKWLFYDKNGFLSSDSTSSNTVSGAAEADGVEVLIRVEKSRVGRPFRSARMYLDLNTMEVDYDLELIHLAKYFGVLEQSGAWFVMPTGEKLHGLKQVREVVADDPKTRKLLVDTVQSKLVV